MRCIILQDESCKKKQRPPKGGLCFLCAFERPGLYARGGWDPRVVDLVGSHHQPTRPFEEAVKMGGQHLTGDRFHEVIVRSAVECGCHDLGVVESGEDNDGHVAKLADGAAYLATIHVWHH